MILFPYGRILAEKGDIDKNGPIHYIQYPSRLIADTMVTGDFLLLPPSLPSFSTSHAPSLSSTGLFLNEETSASDYSEFMPQFPPPQRKLLGERSPTIDISILLT